MPPRSTNWRLDDKLVEVLSRNPDADIAPNKAAYLAHIRQRALAYRALSQQLQGRDIALVMLLHHNLINALWLDEVLAAGRTALPSMRSIASCESRSKWFTCAERVDGGTVRYL